MASQTYDKENLSETGGANSLHRSLHSFEFALLGKPFKKDFGHEIRAAA